LSRLAQRIATTLSAHRIGVTFLSLGAKGGPISDSATFPSASWISTRASRDNHFPPNLHCAIGGKIVFPKNESTCGDFLRSNFRGTLLA
jgi:hypothetical protein